MKLIEPREGPPGESLAAVARGRFQRIEGRPLFYSDWDRALFMHFDVDRDVLQRHIPFALDLHHGRAVVSLVAFTMRGLRFPIGGRLGALLTAPGATHGLLNVRTYIRHNDEVGIYFMREWIPNRLSILIGPRTYGLPYRYGKLAYHHDHEHGQLRGTVIPGGNCGRLVYEVASAREIVSNMARAVATNSSPGEDHRRQRVSRERAVALGVAIDQRQLLAGRTSSLDWQTALGTGGGNSNRIAVMGASVAFATNRSPDQQRCTNQQPAACCNCPNGC